MGCQARPAKEVSSAKGTSDHWFSSARLGNWVQFEELQKRMNRPWDFQSANGQTALMIAARNGHSEFVQKLIAKNVDINRKDYLDYSALSYALHGPVTIDKKKSMCQLLVEKGADPFSEDQFKLSPILVMIEIGLKNCIKSIKLKKNTPCDLARPLTGVPSLVVYAEKEEESELSSYFKSQGCP